jgi:PAS domain S-box-containing protein
MKEESVALSLIQNASVLICFVLLFDYFLKNINVKNNLINKLLTGLFVSAIGFLLMSTPWSITPGLFFDTRSILLSIAGLFLGPIPTFFAMVVLGIYRYSIGGEGVYMGLSTIFTAGIIGILWSILGKITNKSKNKFFKLAFFGLVVHLFFMASTFFLPVELRNTTLSALILPVLLIYVPGTIMIGLLMFKRIDIWEAGNLLSESQALYSSLVDHMPAGVFRKAPDGRYDFVNDRFCQLKGLKREEILGRTPKELADYEEKKNSEGGYLTPPVQRTLVTQGTDHHEWIMRHGMPIIVEEAYNQADGHVEFFQVVKTPIFDSKGKVLGTQGMQFDITTAKKNQDALAYEKFLLKSFMDNTPDTIFFKDIESRFIRINKAQIKVLGLNDEHEAIGKSDFDFFSIIHARVAYEDEQFIIRTGKSLINKEEKATMSDGREYWFSTSKFPLKDKDGKIIGTYGVSKNITDQKNLEEELIAAKTLAEESDHLKTAFLHNISHEIRTPMNAIIGFSGFLNDPGISESEKSHFTQIIVQSSNQLMSIIDDIVLIATIEAGQEKINEKEMKLNTALMFEYEKFLSKANEKGLDFVVNPGLTDPGSVIIADETKLIQIISNLLSNAFKFTNKGRIEYGYNLKKEVLEFYVKDSGIGIPHEMHNEIFQRFRQVDSSISRQYGGSGLGLSICKAYLDLMDGKIWVESENGSGSCFYFTIPYKKAVMPEHISELEPEKNKTKINFTYKILVAEDEDLNFMLVKELLRPYNLHLIRAENGVEAVNMVTEMKDIALVFMDLKMPVMDGFEATRLIKGIRPELEVIALTAYSLEADKIKALSSGCSDVVVKPIKKEILFEKLRGLIGDKNN